MGIIFTFTCDVNIDREIIQTMTRSSQLATYRQMSLFGDKIVQNPAGLSPYKVVSRAMIATCEPMPYKRYIKRHTRRSSQRV